MPDSRIGAPVPAGLGLGPPLGEAEVEGGACCCIPLKAHPPAQSFQRLRFGRRLRRLREQLLHLPEPTIGFRVPTPLPKRAAKGAQFSEREVLEVEHVRTAPSRDPIYIRRWRHSKR